MHLAIRFDVLAIGAMAGLGYAILGAGLVLVYRATKIINLAHGQIGALSAVIMIELSVKAGLPYPVCIVLAIASGAVIGLIVERLLVRPLAERSRLAVLVATIGVTEVLLVAQLKMPTVAQTTFPVPVQVDWQFHNLVIRGEHIALLVFGPLFLIGLAVFMRWTRYGLAIRAVAENRDAATLAGVRAARVSSVVWLLAGGLAAVAAILTMPLTGTSGAIATPALGPGLLLRALAAGVAGRLSNLPATVIAGISIGIVEAVLYASYPTNLGIVDGVLFVGILVMLLVRGRRGTESEDSVAFGVDPVPLAPELRTHPVVRRIRVGGAVLVTALVVLLPVVYTTSSQLFLLARIPIYAIIGLSIVVLTGWAGQLSLGQMAFVGVGAMGTAALVSRGVPFTAAVAYATIAGILLAAIIGIPALRLRGLLLAVVTLGLAVAASSYILPAELFRSSQTDVATVMPGHLGPLDLNSYRTLYYCCVAALIAVVLLCRRLRTTGVGRRLIAVEGNEDAAATMAVSPATAKLTAFAISGGIATFAGGLLAGVTQSFGVEVFSPQESLQVLAMVVVGGVGSIAGAILGAIYLIGVPAILGDSTTIQLATSGIGLLVVLRFFPSGLVGVLNRLRDRLLPLVVPGATVVLVAADHTAAGTSVAAHPPRGDAEVPHARLASLHTRDLDRVDAVAAAHGPDDLDAPEPLRLDAVSVTIDERDIVRGVDLTIGHEEIVGLIGANGAGKTTLMNAVSGFVPTRGRILLAGTDISGDAPADRAALGLGRSFQGAELFPRLAVHECLQVALEVRRRSEVVPSLLALPPSIRTERWSHAEADELVDLFGLGAYADKTVGALSTGTRRVVEFACLIAQRPKVVLLDEPMAGIAQREAEAFAPLLLEVRRALGAAILVIEHDLPLVMAISDRLYCMEAGVVIASGSPTEVRADPRVVASYLGADERAIARSGAASADPTGTALDEHHAHHEHVVEPAGRVP